jgi:multidrug efflux pump
MTSFAFILGVVPLVVAQGAGAEMRSALGIAVFSGMLGVTFFGIFLTPVFFYVIVGIDESRLLASAGSRRLVSCFLGGLLGGAGGFLLGKLEVVRLPWSAIVGTCAGVLMALAILEIHRRVKPIGIQVSSATQDGPNTPVSRPPDGRPDCVPNLTTNKIAADGPVPSSPAPDQPDGGPHA